MEKPYNIQKNDIQPIKTSVPALDRTVLILNYVSSCETPPSAAEITRSVNLPRSTAHGLISSLVSHGLLHKNNEQRYTISGQVMHWVNGFLTQQNVVTLFNTEIVTHSELSPYSLTLTYRDNTDVVCLSCHNGNSRLGFTFHIGLRLPVIFAATGKAMLSTENNESIKEIFLQNKKERLTPHSTTTLDKLLTSLEQTRKKGFSIDDREIRDGMLCIGVPVFDHSQTAHYGIALSLQKADANSEIIDTLGRTLRRCADQLSQRLGADTISLQ